jgi:hypothetical protein
MKNHLPENEKISNCLIQQTGQHGTLLDKFIIKQDLAINFDRLLVLQKHPQFGKYGCYQMVFDNGLICSLSSEEWNVLNQPKMVQTQ